MVEVLHLVAHTKKRLEGGLMNTLMRGFCRNCGSVVKGIFRRGDQASTSKSCPVCGVMFTLFFAGPWERGGV